jgi:cell division protein FtsN
MSLDRSNVARYDRRATRRVGARAGTSPHRSGRGGTLLGLFVGIALGLALAAGVAYWLLRAGNPYQAASGPKEPPREAGREPSRTARAEPGPAEKPRFDFYKILPGVEEPKVQPKTAEHVAPDKATVERAATPEKGPDRLAKLDERPVAPPAGPDKGAKPGERFWLQAGSFTNEADAENLKARLALAGWEAGVQSATLPDKGLRYRVRLGPYDNTDELNKIKGELAKRGFDVAVIKY